MAFFTITLFSVLAHNTLASTSQSKFTWFHISHNTKFSRQFTRTIKIPFIHYPVFQAHWDHAVEFTWSWFQSLAFHKLNPYISVHTVIHPSVRGPLGPMLGDHLTYSNVQSPDFHPVSWHHWYSGFSMFHSSRCDSILIQS